MNKPEYYLKLVMTNDFPYDNYNEKELRNDYLNLKRNTANKKSNTGLKVVRQYYPSIWRCNIKNHLSPLDAWQDTDIIYKVILNRLKYLDERELSNYNIRNGLSITKLAPKVSVFRPMAAKYLIEKYLNEFDTIFDPCCGFGGRMLGTCCLNKKYIGQDINSITIKETKKLIQDFELDAHVETKNSLYDEATYDCLFTCPPYGDKEIWHQDIEVISTDEWIDTLLTNYHCKKYLFIVDKTERYKNYIVEEIKNNSHFGSNSEKIILIKSSAGIYIKNNLSDL